jgi:hypothetical protein
VIAHVSKSGQLLGFHQLVGDLDGSEPPRLVDNGVGDFILTVLTASALSIEGYQPPSEGIPRIVCFGVDTRGSLRWMRELSSRSIKQIPGIACDAVGNLYAAAVTDADLDIGPESRAL